MEIKLYHSGDGEWTAIWINHFVPKMIGVSATGITPDSALQSLKYSTMEAQMRKGANNAS